MAVDTEVISCPACAHLLRVPLDWLGTAVQCPECKAKFKAPVRGSDGLTAPELISQPTRASAPRKKLDAMLLVPAFGLLLCGVVGAVANGYLCATIFGKPDEAREWVSSQIEQYRKLAQRPADSPEAERAGIEQDAARLLSFYSWFVPLSLLESLVALLGGLSMVLRWNYWLAQIGCVAAAINFAHCCCVPGGAAGLWGILMLNSEEGRAHFGKSL